MASFFTFKVNRIWQKILEEKKLKFTKNTKLLSDVLSVLDSPIIAYLFYGHL